MDQEKNRSGLIFGTILIVIGILFFVGQVFNFMDWGSLWPIVIIGVGLALFAGMLLGGKSASGLAIPGSIVTTVGLILFAQNALGWWQSWSYAWGLIVASVGVGIAIHGMRNGDEARTRHGWEVARTGVILFLVFGAIFEFIYSLTGISGRDNRLFWALLIVALGLLQLGTRIYRLIFNPSAVTEHNRDLGGPVLLTGFGVLATLGVMGILTSSQLLSLVGLWPLLLVGAGIQIIFGRRWPWVGALVSLAILAAALTFAFAGERLGIRLGAPWMFGPISFGDKPWAVRERVTGNGTMGEKTYEVSDFDDVDLQLVGKMEIVQGEREALTISAEENLLPYLTVEVNGGTLEIGVQRGVGLTPTKDITYKLSVKDLKAFSLSGAAEVTMDKLTTGDFTLTTSGAGSFYFGDVQAKKFEVRISGAGSVAAAGKADELQINISGAGSFKGPNLQVQQADVRISGLGSATLWVEDKLSTNISGAGSVNYYGDPQVDQRNSGAGVVRRSGNK